MTPQSLQMQNLSFGTTHLPLEYIYSILQTLESNSSSELINVSYGDLEVLINLQRNQNETSDNSQSYQVPTGIVVLLSIFYGFISLIAVIGNALVIWIVASSRNMHSVTNYFIANLALADIIIGLFSIPFQFQAALLQRWNLPFFMCAFCPFLQTVSVNVSVFTLTAIAVDRYRAIVYPLNARPSKFKSKVVIGCIWLFSSALAVPNAVALRVKIIKDSRGEVKPVCGAHNLDPLMMQTYMHILVCVQYFFPLCIISFAYIRIGWELWGAQTPGNANDGRDAHVLKNKKKVIKMVFVVVAIFALCWAPLQGYYILTEIYPSINDFQYINYIWFASHWLAMSNSGCNPFIYAIYNEKFKREFRHKFRFMLRNPPGVDIKDLERFRNQASFRSIRTTAISGLSSDGFSSQRGSFSNFNNEEGGTSSLSGTDKTPPMAHSNKILLCHDDRAVNKVVAKPSVSMSLKQSRVKLIKPDKKIFRKKYHNIPLIKIEDTCM